MVNESSDSIVRICKRENNTKRNYLVLNEAQCKHFPSSPTKALEMFKRLADSLTSVYDNESVICVGFAETATAIGLEVAKTKGYDYMHTTREPLNCDTFNFSEEHSHATEQTLAYEDFSLYDRVLFVEDEVTTGKTILNIIDVLKKSFPDLKYGVASILNGMTEEQMDSYTARNIPVSYLYKIDNSSFPDIASSISTSGSKYSVSSAKVGVSNEYTFTNNVDARRKINTRNYTSSLSSICNKLQIGLPKDAKICVVGTEEFMHPAITIGSYLEKQGYPVVSHSTTRSPIEVSKDEGYPLTSRCELPSVYDRNRNTYIYNLASYDKVIIVTEKSTCVDSLVKALSLAGNSDIDLIRIGV